MEAIFGKQRPKPQVADEPEADDEFAMELSANKFRETVKQTAREQTQTAKSVASGTRLPDSNQEVYLDKLTGKIIVNPRKSDQMTGIKRTIDRRDREADLEKEGEVT